jgi:hypothetical protein
MNFLHSFALINVSGINSCVVTMQTTMNNEKITLRKFLNDLSHELLRRCTSVRQASSLSRELVMKVNNDHASSKEAVNLPKITPKWNHCVACS